MADDLSPHLKPTRGLPKAVALDGSLPAGRETLAPDVARAGPEALMEGIRAGDSTSPLGSLSATGRAGGISESLGSSSAASLGATSAASASHSGMNSSGGGGSSELSFATSQRASAQENRIEQPQIKQESNPNPQPIKTVDLASLTPTPQQNPAHTPPPPTQVSPTPQNVSPPLTQVESQKASPSREVAAPQAPDRQREQDQYKSRDEAQQRETLKSQGVVESRPDPKQEKVEVQRERSIYFAPSAAEKEQARQEGRETRVQSPEREARSADDGRQVVRSERAPVSERVSPEAPKSSTERVERSAETDKSRESAKSPEILRASETERAGTEVRRPERSSHEPAVRASDVRSSEGRAPESRVAESRASEASLKDFSIARPVVTSEGSQAARESARDSIVSRVAEIAARSIEAAKSTDAKGREPTTPSLPRTATDGNRTEGSKRGPEILRSSRETGAKVRERGSGEKSRDPKAASANSKDPALQSEKKGIQALADRIRRPLGKAQKPGLKERVTKETADAKQKHATEGTDKAATQSNSRGSPAVRIKSSPTAKSAAEKDSKTGAGNKSLSEKETARSKERGNTASLSERVKADGVARKESHGPNSGQSYSERRVTDERLSKGAPVKAASNVAEQRGAREGARGQELSERIEARSRASTSGLRGTIRDGAARDGVGTEAVRGEGSGVRTAQREQGIAALMKDDRDGASLAERVKQGTATPVERVTHEVVEFVKGLFGMNEKVGIEPPVGQPVLSPELEEFTDRGMTSETEIDESLDAEERELNEFELAQDPPSESEMEQVYSIRGKVAEFASARPLPGITVELIGVAQVTTDARGEYLFENIPAGTNYFLQIIPGLYEFTPDRVSGVVSGYATHHFFGKRRP